MPGSSKAFPSRFQKKAKELTLSEAKLKLCAFCSFQERSIRQVMQKMKLLLVQEEWQNQILEHLKTEGYLNENRFADSMARGKSMGRGWGPQKIQNKLRMEGIEKNQISDALEKVDWTNAENKLIAALVRKKQELDRKSDPQWKSKLLRFCLSRGFDMRKSLDILNQRFSGGFEASPED